MSNVRFYPDESIKEFRFEEDVEYLVVNEEDWKRGRYFGSSFTSFGTACQYAYQHEDTNWIIFLN